MSLPDRWIQYEAYGHMIKGTKILPFKVPLKKKLVEGLKNDERFTPQVLLQAFPRLKYIIDLTNTSRYYDQQDFSDANVTYSKINVPGKMIPPFGCVTLFFRKLDLFLSHAGEDDIVGIHCTHGINRTGYLICRYLIEKLGWTFKDSLNAFEEARGYQIERREYIDDLNKISRNSSKTSPSSSWPQDRVPASSWPQDRVPASSWPQDRVPASSWPQDRVPASSWRKDRVPASSWPQDRVPASSWRKDRVPSSSWQKDRVPASSWRKDRGPSSSWQKDRVPASSWRKNRVPASSWRKDRVPSSSW